MLSHQMKPIVKIRIFCVFITASMIPSFQMMTNLCPSVKFTKLTQCRLLRNVVCKLSPAMGDLLEFWNADRSVSHLREMAPTVSQHFTAGELIGSPGVIMIGGGRSGYSLWSLRPIAAHRQWC